MSPRSPRWPWFTGKQRRRCTRPSGRPSTPGSSFAQDGAYKFLHDRIQQAAYSLIPDEQRAEVHLRIGRALLASMTADELAEHLFDVANQFNRGAARLIDRDEKAQVAAIDLRAGRKAKASAAYASACVYLAAGMALLDERDWSSQYELMFSLRLERAECEFLTGNFDKAEQLIVELLQRGASKVDQAAVYHLKIQLHIVKSENAQAVDSALDVPAPVRHRHPGTSDLGAGPGRIRDGLADTSMARPIESLIDLPLMTDPELQAAMQCALGPARPRLLYRLSLILPARMPHGEPQHAARNERRVRARLWPCWDCPRPGLSPLSARVIVSPSSPATLSRNTASSPTRRRSTMRWGWLPSGRNRSRPRIDFNRAAFRAASETGDLTYACFSMDQIRHRPSPAERSARRGVARVGEGPGLRPRRPGSATSRTSS